MKHIQDNSLTQGKQSDGYLGMQAIVTTGTGGYEKLENKRVHMLVAGPGEVLLKVLAAGVNNTEINTRLGWYSSSVTQATGERSNTEDRQDGGWKKRHALSNHPGHRLLRRSGLGGRCGDAGGIGQRVLVRACMREHGFDRMDTLWMGSDFDGAFAQYVKVPASQVFAVHCDWRDAELATLGAARLPAAARGRGPADPALNAPVAARASVAPDPVLAGLLAERRASRNDLRPAPAAGHSAVRRA